MGFVHIEGNISDLKEFFTLGSAPRQSEKRRCRRERQHANQDDLPLMKLTASVHRKIMTEIGGRPPERGGVLIGPIDESLATHFVFDDTGVCTGASWTFGHVRLNQILREHLPLGLDAKGYVHSHPAHYRRLSSGDMVIPQRAFANAKNQELHEVWMPILVDGDLLPFIIFRNNPDHAAPARLVLV